MSSANKLSKSYKGTGCTTVFLGNISWISCIYYVWSNVPLSFELCTRAYHEHFKTLLHLFVSDWSVCRNKVTSSCERMLSRGETAKWLWGVRYFEERWRAFIQVNTFAHLFVFDWPICVHNYSSALDFRLTSSSVEILHNVSHSFATDWPTREQEWFKRLCVGSLVTKCKASVLKEFVSVYLDLSSHEMKLQTAQILAKDVKIVNGWGANLLICLRLVAHQNGHSAQERQIRPRTYVFNERTKVLKYVCMFPSAVCIRVSVRLGMRACVHACAWNILM